MFGKTIKLIILLILIGVMIAVQYNIVSKREKVWMQEKLYLLPSPKITKILSSGHEHTLADVLWIRAIQYFGGNFSRMDGDGFKNLLGNIITLDPKFKGAYEFGSFALTEGLEDYDAAVEHLMKGHEEIPDYWKLPFDAGFIRFYNQNNPEDAIKLFKIANSLPDCPSYVARMIPKLYSDEGQLDTAIEIYTRQLDKAKSKVEIKLLTDHLLNAYMKRDALLLEDASEKYVKLTGEEPDRYLEKLVTAGILRKLPVEPHGGYYYLDPDDKIIKSSYPVYHAKKTKRNQIQRALDAAYLTGIPFPPSLEQAEAEGIIEGPIFDPMEGGYGYDPATGKLPEVTCAKEFAPSGLIPFDYEQ